MQPVYLNAKQVAALCSCGDKCVSAWSVVAWTRAGVLIRGTKVRVRLGCVELPKGRAWTREGVAEFLAKLSEARAEARGERNVGCGMSDVGGGKRKLRLAGEGFLRCPVDQIGTYRGMDEMDHGPVGTPARVEHAGRAAVAR